jgi:hypothetical protein
MRQSVVESVQWARFLNKDFQATLSGDSFRQYVQLCREAQKYGQYWKRSSAIKTRLVKFFELRCPAVASTFVVRR